MQKNDVLVKTKTHNQENILVGYTIIKSNYISLLNMFEKSIIKYEQAEYIKNETNSAWEAKYVYETKNKYFDTVVVFEKSIFTYSSNIQLTDEQIKSIKLKLDLK